MPEGCNAPRPDPLTLQPPQQVAREAQVEQDEVGVRPDPDRAQHVHQHEDGSRVRPIGRVEDVGEPVHRRIRLPGALLLLHGEVYALYGVNGTDPWKWLSFQPSAVRDATMVARIGARVSASPSVSTTSPKAANPRAPSA